MQGRNQSLLTEVERGALDDDVPLAATLRKCVALGGQAKSAELRTWARQELNGYENGNDLPEWRIVGAVLKIDGQTVGGSIVGQQIGSMFLPEFARDVIKEECPLPMGVVALESMLSGDDEFVHLGPPGASDLVGLMNHQNSNHFEHIERLYWSVSKASIRGVLDRIRTTLVTLVAELRAGMPDDEDMPNAELASQAVNVAVHGKGHTVTVATAQSGAYGNSDATQPVEKSESRRWKRWAKVGGFVVGVATIIATVITLAEFFNKPADLPRRTNIPPSVVVTSSHNP